jgi:hypothetical protein
VLILVLWKLVTKDYYAYSSIAGRKLCLLIGVRILPLLRSRHNPAHQDLSNNTNGTLQFLQNFGLRFNLIFSEEIIQYSRAFAPQVQTSWNQADAPLLVESFPKTPKVMESSRCTPPGGELSKDSKGHGIKPMHPSSRRAFQRHQEHDLQHPPWVDLITTKQNKTKYLHRYPMETHCSVFRLVGMPMWVRIPLSWIKGPFAFLYYGQPGATLGWGTFWKVVTWWWWCNIWSEDGK